MIELIEKYGGVFNKNVTRKCQYLVTYNGFKMDHNQNLTTKHQNAIKNKVKIMTEEWINDCIKQKQLIDHEETDNFGRNYCINKNSSFLKSRNMGNNRIIPQQNPLNSSTKTKNTKITDQKYAELNARIQTLEQQNINNNERMAKLEAFLYNQ